jgi:S-adenosylmethionine decarboxylase
LKSQIAQGNKIKMATADAPVFPEKKDFFEGPEKLLEMWFTSSTNEDGDLRIIERSDWEKLLQHVHCEIITEKEDGDMKAYVLSESSMFVSKKRFILKTCGQTTLLYAVKPLMQLVKEKCHFDVVEDLFYSRKNFQRPELQHKIHQNFEHEVALLDKQFNNGAAYCLGRINGECWYLYTLDNIGVVEPDQTLELLMQDLDPGMMHIFTNKGSRDAAEATMKSGIDKLLPGTLIDDFLFEPCGYSMNGILPNGEYITIHVTPEPHCSYVSFETNVSQSSFHELIQKLLSVFKPGKFLMTVFANKDSLAADTHKQLRDVNFIDGYKRSDHQFCQFKNYNLTYTHYTRPTPPAAPPH